MKDHPVILTKERHHEAMMPWDPRYSPLARPGREETKVKLILPSLIRQWEAFGKVVEGHGELRKVSEQD